jgi:ABC-type Fe3+/spermidine/putrescine transport system ATPase subunit
VLVCDTLTAVLPERRRGELRDVLGTVARAHGLPVVIATSEPREALSLADEVAVLHGGRVVQVAAALLLYRRPANRTVAELLGGGNFLHARVLRCAGGFALVDTAAGPFRAALPEGFEPAVGHDATLLIRPESLHVERMPADENSLEGRIARVEYAGAEARYTFRSGDVTLQIRELNPRFTSPPPADLWVWADAEDVVVLPG